MVFGGVDKGGYKVKGVMNKTQIRAKASNN
jgi:hypothetical protein